MIHALGGGPGGLARRDASQPRLRLIGALTGGPVNQGLVDT
jgi:hypothetical protein